MACVHIYNNVHWCSGIDFDHPDFGGRIDKARSADYIDSNGDGMDYNGHGTHCAGKTKFTSQLIWPYSSA